MIVSSSLEHPHHLVPILPTSRTVTKLVNQPNDQDHGKHKTRDTVVLDKPEGLPGMRSLKHLDHPPYRSSSPAAMKSSISDTLLHVDPLPCGFGQPNDRGHTVSFMEECQIADGELQYAPKSKLRNRLDIASSTIKTQYQRQQHQPENQPPAQMLRNGSEYTDPPFGFLPTRQSPRLLPFYHPNYCTRGHWKWLRKHWALDV